MTKMCHLDAGGVEIWTKCCNIFCDEIPMTKPQSTTQDVIRTSGGRPGPALTMDRCIYCDVNAKCYTILCHVTRPTEVGRRQLRACLFIRLKTDTFGHALLQHSLLQVGAQVVYLL